MTKWPATHRRTFTMSTFARQHTAVTVAPSVSTLRRDPEALFPRAAGRNTLQVLVDALLREVQRVGDGDHGLEGDEAAVGEGGRGAAGPGEAHRRRRRPSRPAQDQRGRAGGCGCRDRGSAAAAVRPGPDRRDPRGLAAATATERSTTSARSGISARGSPAVPSRCI